MDFTKIFDFAGEIPSGAKYVAALFFVLVLILFVSWLLKKITARVRIGGRRGGRLKVQETIMVDTSRTLTLVSCDNVEHLILLGGNSDLVVASNIQKIPSAVKNSPMTVALAPTVQAPAPQPAAPAHVQPAHAQPAPPAAAVAPLQREPRVQPPQPAPVAAAVPPHTPPLQPQPEPAVAHTPQPAHYRPPQQNPARPLPTPSPRPKPSPAPHSPSPEPAQSAPTPNSQAGQEDTEQQHPQNDNGHEPPASPSLSSIRPGDEK